MHKTSLTTATLGQTALEITRVGFGAWAVGGGGWEFGWGARDDDQSIAAIHRALSLGVNWIDTAAAYGFGHSEQVVGRALEGLSGAERPYVFTKASLLEGPGRTVLHSLHRDSILHEAEASLKRLGIDAIDLYQIHWPIPDEDIEQGWAAFAELKEQGMVGRRILGTRTAWVVAFLLGWGILRVLALIPAVGGLIWFAAVVFGLGALTVTIWRARSTSPAGTASA